MYVHVRLYRTWYEGKRFLAHTYIHLIVIYMCTSVNAHVWGINLEHRIFCNANSSNHIIDRRPSSIDNPSVLICTYEWRYVHRDNKHMWKPMSSHSHNTYRLPPSPSENTRMNYIPSAVEYINECNRNAHLFLCPYIGGVYIVLHTYINSWRYSSADTYHTLSLR